MCPIQIVYKNHMTQNGCRVQVSCENDTTTMQDARFMTMCQVSSCTHKNIFYTKRKLKGATYLVKPFKIFNASEIINMCKFPLTYMIE